MFNWYLQVLLNEMQRQRMVTQGSSRTAVNGAKTEVGTIEMLTRKRSFPRSSSAQARVVPSVLATVQARS